MTILTTLIDVLKDHWVKIIIAVLVALAVAAVAKCEREEIRQDETLVKTGEQKATIERQEGTLRNVEKANRAEREPTLDERQRVSDKYDRCAAPGSCE